MGSSRENRFTVHQRLAASEARLNTLEAENKQLRQWVLGELTSKINDAKNVIQDSIRVPQDGAPGKDGRDGVDGRSIVGPAGPKGDVLTVSESELAAAVKDLRRKMAEKHAAFIAVIVKNIEHEKKSDQKIHQHYARLLESILDEINRWS